MRSGRLVISLDAQGSGVHVAHAVEADDREPGVPAALQPARHVVDLVLFDVSLRAQLGLSDAWAVELRVPLGAIWTTAEFYDARDALLPSFDSIHHRDELLGGLGDPELGGRWVALSGDLDLELRAGLSLPLGHTEPDPYALGRMGLKHTHQFLGAGTLVPSAGIDASWSLGADWALLGGVAARLPMYENADGYRASRALSTSLRAAWSIDVWQLQLGPELRVESTAQWSGRDAENSGRVDLVVAAAAIFTPSATWQLHLSAQVPVFIEASGSQVTQPVVIGVGARHAVDLWE